MGRAGKWKGSIRLVCVLYKFMSNTSLEPVGAKKDGTGKNEHQEEQNNTTPYPGTTATPKAYIVI